MATKPVQKKHRVHYLLQCWFIDPIVYRTYLKKKQDPKFFNMAQTLEAVPGIFMHFPGYKYQKPLFLELFQHQGAPTKSCGAPLCLPLQSCEPARESPEDIGEPWGNFANR